MTGAWLYLILQPSSKRIAMDTLLGDFSYVEVIDETTRLFASAMERLDTPSRAWLVKHGVPPIDLYNRHFPWFG